MNESKIIKLYSLNELTENDRKNALFHLNEAVKMQRAGAEPSAILNVQRFLSYIGATELGTSEFQEVHEKTNMIVQILAADSDGKISVKDFKFDRGLWSSRNLRENKKVSKEDYRWDYQVNVPIDSKEDKISKENYRWKKTRI